MEIDFLVVRGGEGNSFSLSVGNSSSRFMIMPRHTAHFSRKCVRGCGWRASSISVW